jgi:hypothetical protein
MLDAIESHYGAEGWDLPERRYVAAGSHRMIAADDEHLAISLSQMTPGASDASQRSGGYLSRGAGAIGPPRAEFAVRLMRCVATLDDTGEPPSTAELHDDGLRLLMDPGRLMTALFAWRENELHPANANPNVTIGACEVIGPMGGLAGHSVMIVIGPVS